MNLTLCRGHNGYLRTEANSHLPPVDGSGGGDAKQVTCSATPTTWTVPSGTSQIIALTCDAIVAPAVVRQIQYVYAGQQP